MDKYIFFDKTADAKFQAFGVTLEECFKNAEEAMISIMYSVQDIIDYEFETEERELSCEGQNLESLLYNFLEEILFLLSAETFVGLVEKIFIKKSDDGYKLKATVRGTQCINFESNGEVKASTYNEMFVKYDEEKQQYIAQAVVDL